MPEVLLSGYYGYGNAGDDALCLALAQGLRAAGAERILVPAGPGWLPESVERLPRWDVRALDRALARGAVLFSGGGGLLQDITSRRSLAYYLTVIWLARRRRRPYVLGFQSIGPLASGWGRRAVAIAARGAAAVGVRDQRSRRALLDLGLAPEAVTTASDAAFLLPPGICPTVRSWAFACGPRRTPRPSSRRCGPGGRRAQC